MAASRNNLGLEDKGPIVLYDGLCGLCDASVDFIIDHDPAGQFRFARLESEIGRQLLGQHVPMEKIANTMVLIDGNRTYVRSTAVMRICHLLGGQLNWMGNFLAMLPLAIRDWTYNQVARHRYQLFGRRVICRMPKAGIAARFL